MAWRNGWALPEDAHGRHFFIYFFGVRQQECNFAFGVLEVDVNERAGL